MAVRDLKLKEFSDRYFSPLDEELGLQRSHNEEEQVPLILTETEGILRLLLSYTKPDNILEIGTAHGYSALFFAKYLPHAHIRTIERNPAMAAIAKENFAAFEEGARIEMFEGDALEILQSFLDSNDFNNENDKFDFVFIDAAKSHYREFLEIAEKMCKKNALIVCDNVLLKGWIVEPVGSDAKRHRTNIKYMRQFLDYIKEREDLDVTYLTGGDGLAIIKLNNDK